MQYSWLSVEQPIRFWLSVAYLSSEIQQKIIPMFTCPIGMTYVDRRCAGKYTIHAGQRHTRAGKCDAHHSSIWYFNLPPLTKNSPATIGVKSLWNKNPRCPTISFYLKKNKSWVNQQLKRREKLSKTLCTLYIGLRLLLNFLVSAMCDVKYL